MKRTLQSYGSSSPLCLINCVGFINCGTQLSGGRCMLFVTKLFLYKNYSLYIYNYKLMYTYTYSPQYHISKLYNT